MYKIKLISLRNEGMSDKYPFSHNEHTVTARRQRHNSTSGIMKILLHLANDDIIQERIIIYKGRNYKKLAVSSLILWRDVRRSDQSAKNGWISCTSCILTKIMCRSMLAFGLHTYCAKIQYNYRGNVSIINVFVISSIEWFIISE